jgi:hypothetical protein
MYFNFLDQDSAREEPQKPGVLPVDRSECSKIMLGKTRTEESKTHRLRFIF